MTTSPTNELDVNVRIGRRVRARMATQGATQTGIAELLGVAQPQIHRRLEGRVAFRIDELKAIAAYLDTTVEKLT